MNMLSFSDWLSAQVNIERLGWVLIHSLWQFTLVALIAVVALRVPRKNASAVRYGILLAAILSIAVLPGITWFQLEAMRPAMTTSAKMNSDDIAESTSNAWSFPLEDKGEVVEFVELPDSALDILNETPQSDASSDLSVGSQHANGSSTLPIGLGRIDMRPWLGWIVLAWSCGVVAFSARLLFGLYTLQRLRHVGLTPVSDDIQTSLDKVSAMLRMHGRVRVLHSSLAQIPIVIGYIRPLILLPVSLVTNLPGSQLEAILAHELAHVRRHDFLVNLYQSVIESLFFYHPAVWWLSYQLRIEREHCCDDTVVKLLNNRIEYGRALVAIEELRGHSSGLQLSSGGGSLLSRIRRIASAPIVKPRAGAWSGVWAAVLVCTIGCTALLSSTLEALTETECAKVVLPDGSSIALLGVTSDGTDPARWWSADGKPLDGHPLTGHQTTLQPDWGTRRRFAVRTTGAQRVAWFFPGDGQYQSSGTEGHHPDYLREEVIAPLALPSLDPITVECGVGEGDFGPWSTIGLSGRKSAPKTPPELEPYYQQISEHLRMLIAEDDAANITLTAPTYKYIADHEWAIITKDGRRWPAARSALRSDSSSSTFAITFSVPPDGIDHFEFRLRPYRHWVTFENVSLRRGQKTEVKVATAPPRPEVNAISEAAPEDNAPQQPGSFVATILTERKRGEKANGQRENGPGPADKGEADMIRGLGTGIVIDGREYIATMRHFVESAARIRVSLSGDQTYEARLVGSDIKLDIAVLKIDSPRSLKPASLGMSSKLKKTEPVTMIGWDQERRFQLAKGTVTELGQHVEMNPQTSHSNLIQTDIPINPAQGGAPLMNLNGQVVGIMVALRTGTQKVSFALPVDDLLPVFKQIVEADAGTASNEKNEAAQGDQTFNAVKEEAQRDIADGRLKFKLYGQLSDPDRELLSEQGIRIDVLPRNVTSDDKKRANVYNQVILDHVVAQLGTGAQADHMRAALNKPNEQLIEQASDDRPSQEARVKSEEEAPIIRRPLSPTLVLPDHLNVVAVGFDREGTELVSLSTENDVAVRAWEPDITLRAWGPDRKKPKREVKLDTAKHGNVFLQGQPMLSGDRRHVIAILDRQVTIWDANTGKLVKTLGPPLEMQNSQLRCLAVTPDLALVACGRSPGFSGIDVADTDAIIWDVAAGRVLRTVSHPKALQIQSVALSPDGKFLATGGQEAGLCLWDLGTGKLLYQLPNDNAGKEHPNPEVSAGGANQVLSLRFSPDGQQLALGDMLGVKMLEASTGKSLFQCEAPFRYGRSGFVFSNDGRMFARIATDKTVPIWSSQTGTLLAELPTEALDGTFSEDNRSFVVGFTDQKLGLAVWPLVSGTARANINSNPASGAGEPRPAQETPVKEVDLLQGEWALKEWQEEGVEGSVYASADDLKGKKLLINGNVMSGVGIGGSMSFKLNAEKTPNEIDLTILDGNRKGITEQGIYKLEGDNLRICFGGKGRPKEFATPAGSGRGLLTLQKAPGDIGPGQQTDVKVTVESLPEENPRAAIQAVEPVRDATQEPPKSDAKTDQPNSASEELSPNPREVTGYPRRAQVRILTPNVKAQDWPQWGGTIHRNNIAVGQTVPMTWNVETRENVKWSVPLGSETYSSPVIANGKVFIGTNNGHGYVKEHPASEDISCLLAFDEPSGNFLWQASNLKLPAGRAEDWPNIGICSTPYCEGDRVWYVTNKAEVMCLDAEGFHDGENDGPVTDERLIGPDHADIVWRFDMMAKLGMKPHHATNCSVTCLGDRLFVVVSSGVDSSKPIAAQPKAPSFVCLDRRSGQLLWSDDSASGNVLECHWSSPCVFEVGGQWQVAMGGGDGWVYSFDPVGDGQGRGKLLWKFDTNPKESIYMFGKGTRNYCVATPVFYDGHVYIGNGQDPEKGDGIGHLYCIDPTKRGDVSSELAVDAQGQPLAPRRLRAVEVKQGEKAIPNPNSAMVWHYSAVDRAGLNKPKFEESFHRTVGSVAIANDLLFVADFSGMLHCLDAKKSVNDQPVVHWTHDLLAACWSTPLIADGKVFVADEDGDVTIFKLSAQKTLLAERNVGATTYSTPAVANHTLFLAMKNRLLAITDPNVDARAGLRSPESALAPAADLSKSDAKTDQPNHANRPQSSDSVEEPDDKPRALFGGWGPKANGLRARIVPVQSSIKDEALEAAQRVMKFATVDDVAFVVELQNVSDQPIKLVDVWREVKTEIPIQDADWLSQFVCSVVLVNRNGTWIETADVEVADAEFVLHDAQVRTLQPGKTYRFIIKPTRRLTALRPQFQAGPYRVAVSYRWPAGPHAAKISEANPWKRFSEVAPISVLSGAVEIEVGGENRQPDLVWGEANNGLRAAMSFTDSKVTHSHGERLDARLHLQNVSDKPIKLVSDLSQPVTAAAIKDELGRNVEVDEDDGGLAPSINGLVTLRPQQIVVLDAGNLGLAGTEEQASTFDDKTARKLIAPAGKYSMQLETSFKNVLTQRVVVPGQEVMRVQDAWVGKLKTGATPLVVEEGNKKAAAKRVVEVRLVGGPKSEPLSNVTVEFKKGRGDDKNSARMFTTDDTGWLKAELPVGFYYLNLTSDIERPFLPFEKNWTGSSFGHSRELNVRVTEQGVEKWLDAQRCERGFEAATKERPARITFTLEPAVEFVLRAVDIETGKGISGAEFYEEVAAGEDWAHRTYSDNIGSRSGNEARARPVSEDLTDNEGYLRRWVAEKSEESKFGVQKPPAGYELIEPKAELTLPIQLGQGRFEQIFTFRRIRWGVQVEPEKMKFVLDTPMWLTFTVTNLTDEARGLELGGESKHRLGRSAAIEIAVINNDGKQLPIPERAASLDGIMKPELLVPNGEAKATLLLSDWAKITHPGIYRVYIKRKLKLFPIKSQQNGQVEWGDTPEIAAVEASCEFEVIPPDAAKVDALQGEWAFKAWQEEGVEVSVYASADELKGKKLLINGNVMSGGGSGIGGSMSFKLNTEKSPNEIDLTILDGKRKGITEQGIYKLEGDQLRICFGGKGRPKEFATPAGSGRGLLTLQKEPLTAWGKEVGGLQAGLSISNATDIHLGGKATVVLRLRNVSNNPITASAWPLWLIKPTIVDGAGKQVRTTSPSSPGFDLSTTDIALKPGQTVVVATNNIFVVDADAKGPAHHEGVADRFTVHVHPGRHSIDLKGFLEGRPAVATGTVDFEVKANKHEKPDAPIAKPNSGPANEEKPHEPGAKQEVPMPSEAKLRLESVDARVLAALQGSPVTKEEKLRVLIDKVLAAHGGEDKLKKLTFYTMTYKHSTGENHRFFIQQPKNYRVEITNQDQSEKQNIILFPNERRGWTKESKVEPKGYVPTGAEFTNEFWLDHVKFFGPRQVLRLKDADHKVALLDEEAKIGDRPAVGVKVAGPHYKHTMYFDKESHLLVQGVSSDVVREVVFSDYKKFDGIPIARKESDGFPVVLEVTEFKVVEKFDAKIFEIP